MAPALLNVSTTSLRTTTTSFRAPQSSSLNSSSVQPSSISRRSGPATRLPTAKPEVERPLVIAQPAYSIDAPEQDNLVCVPDATLSSYHECTSTTLTSSSQTSADATQDSSFIDIHSLPHFPPSTSTASSHTNSDLGNTVSTRPCVQHSEVMVDSGCSTLSDPPIQAGAEKGTGNDTRFHADLVPLTSEASPSVAHSVLTMSLRDQTSEASPSVALSVLTMSLRDQNSVTIKSNTNVKDAAGAICKVLHRLPSSLVTALRLEASHEALNRAIKSVAVARKYIMDENEGHELSFLPVNRSNSGGQQDPNLFAFLCYKIKLAQGVMLLDHDQTDLNVSRGSSASSMANAIIHIIKDRGQAVMKAGGAEAIFIALSALVDARRRLKRFHDMDVMTVPSWITEDTVNTLGRESKFLRFNILPCPVSGPLTPAMA